MCLRSGIVSPLYSLSSSLGTLSGLCSNTSCTYPFDSYDGLQQSITSVPSINSNVADCMSGNRQDHVDNTSGIHLGEVQQTISATTQPSISLSGCQTCENSSVSPSHKTVQKPCAILPRYLADSLKQGMSF